MIVLLLFNLSYFLYINNDYIIVIKFFYVFCAFLSFLFRFFAFDCLTQLHLYAL